VVKIESRCSESDAEVDWILSAVSEAFDSFQGGSSEARAPLRDSCSGAMGGIGKATVGGDITWPKIDAKQLGIMALIRRVSGRCIRMSNTGKRLQLGLGLTIRLWKTDRKRSSSNAWSCGRSDGHGNLATPLSSIPSSGILWFLTDGAFRAAVNHRGSTGNIASDENIEDMRTGLDLIDKPSSTTSIVPPGRMTRWTS
jgi:hypothetical protein